MRSFAFLPPWCLGKRQLAYCPTPYSGRRFKFLLAGVGTYSQIAHSAQNWFSCTSVHIGTDTMKFEALDHLDGGVLGSGHSTLATSLLGNTCPEAPKGCLFWSVIKIKICAKFTLICVYSKSAGKLHLPYFTLYVPYACINKYLNLAYHLAFHACMFGLGLCVCYLLFLCFK